MPSRNATGSMSVPIATKNRTAKTSRNGSSRRRASAASGLSVTARPATNAASASGMPATTAPAPAKREAARDGDDQEQVVLVAKPSEHLGEDHAATAARAANASNPPNATAGGRAAEP